MRKKYIIAITALLIALCLMMSGCKNTNGQNGENGEPDEPQISSGSEDPVGGSKLSPEDQKFLEENGFLTHHTQVDEDSLSWEFDEDTCTLTISGTGPMKDYYYENPAWNEYRDMITKVVIGDGITTVGDYAFYGYMQLRHAEIADTVEYIGVGAFCDAYDLKEIDFPAALKEIGSLAFSEVKIHAPLTIPNGVEIIASSAFHANDFWDTITIPESVYYIQEEAFSNSLHLHEFIVDPDNEFYTAIDGVLYNKDVTTLIAYPTFKETENFSIPDTVTRIGHGAFDINFFMRTLYIPKSVDEVGYYQFGLLRQLEEYIVEDGSELFKTDNGALLSKDGKTFYAYPALSKNKEYSIPDGVEIIEYRAFAETWYLEKLYVPEGIRNVNHSAFTSMNGTELYLPESFTETALPADGSFLYSDTYGWDLSSGFTYIPNTDDCIVANGTKDTKPMKIYYGGDANKWDDFVFYNLDEGIDIWLGYSELFFEK